MRLAHTQVWPAFRYFDAIAPLTAISMSASSKTINGALPPNSIEVFLTVAAHRCISNLPTSVEPVKVSLRTVGLLVSSPPISFDGPVTQEKTPFGTPARSPNSHNASAEYRSRWPASHHCAAAGQCRPRLPHIFDGSRPRTRITQDLRQAMTDDPPGSLVSRLNAGLNRPPSGLEGDTRSRPHAPFLSCGIKAELRSPIDE